jgi:hypothetical protein
VRRKERAFGFREGGYDGTISVMERFGNGAILIFPAIEED